MGKQTNVQVAPVWIVAPENEEGDGWLKGFRLYADGAPEIACTTHAQRSGYRDAMNADAACQVIDVMASNGKGDADDYGYIFYHRQGVDYELPSIQ